MVEWFIGLNPVAQAALAGLFTWGITALGASAVFLFKEINKKVLNGMLGFAAGAMMYVVIEELIPESQRGGYTDLVTIGAIGGFTVMMILDVALG